jgi:hypothetical protein
MKNKNLFPDFEERNDFMHKICETGQIIGGMQVIDGNAIKLLWKYDKWLSNKMSNVNTK